MSFAVRIATAVFGAAACAAMAGFTWPHARDGVAILAAQDDPAVLGELQSRAAIDVLKLAEGPQDVVRAVRLAAAKADQTRAIIKILGRGALPLAAGAFEIVSWIFAACWPSSDLYPRSR